MSASAGVFATLRATPTPVRYLLGGVLLNQLGAFVQTFIVLYLVFRGHSESRAGATLIAYGAGAVLGTVLGGELTHRLGPRRTIASAMSGAAVIVGLVPWLSGPDRYALLLVAVALAGLATQAYRPAAAVLLSELMPEEHRVMAFSMMRIALNIGAAGGPLIAAGLILVDWDLIFWFDSVTAVLYAALALVLLPRTRPHPPERAAPATGAYRVLLGDRRYLLYLASMLLSAVIYVQYTVALPFKITAEGHPTALYSVALASVSVSLILLELKITSYVRHWPPHIAGVVGTSVFALGIASYGAHSGVGILIVLSTQLFVFGIMISGPTMFAYPTTFPAALRARYVGVSQAMFGLGSAVGPAIGVLAWDRLGNGVWPLCGVIGAVAALCAYAGMQKRDQSVPEVVRATSGTH